MVSCHHEEVFVPGKRGWGRNGVRLFAFLLCLLERSNGFAFCVLTPCSCFLVASRSVPFDRITSIIIQGGKGFLVSDILPHSDSSAPSPRALVLTRVFAFPLTVEKRTAVH